MSKERPAKPTFNLPNPTDDDLAQIEEKYIKNYKFDHSLITNVEIDDMLGLHLASLPQIKLNSLEEDIALAKRIEKGGEDAYEAREALLYSVAHMVISEAAKRAKDKQTMMDLVQEGNLVLWEKAIEGYNWRRGFKFSTFAMWWIKAAQSRTINRNSGAYRIPENVIYSSRKVRNTMYQLTAEKGHTPTLEDISEKTEIKPARVKKLLDYTRQRQVSLSSKINPHDDTEIADQLEDENAPYRNSLEDQIDENDITETLKRKVDSELSKLISRQREVLKFRLGIGNQNKWNGERMTFEQIGKIMGGITRERVRQIQRDGLRHIKDREVHELLLTILSTH
ncbi:MAG: sigma-70 family RNA polymerase sigma factor [Candidatus Woesebacteria bacterium]|nr:MAG: sigma-70 family RNA polymerase sigma factor [Candidatus Woesebacteria bacterium]